MMCDKCLAPGRAHTVKHFDEKSTLEGTVFEDLADLVAEVVEFTLESTSVNRVAGPETWTLRNKLSNEFCQQWDERMQHDREKRKGAAQ